MFASAAVNALVALNFSVVTWAAFMPVYGIVSKVVLFLAGFAMMRVIGRRRMRSMPTFERDALMASTERSADAGAVNEFDGNTATTAP